MIFALFVAARVVYLDPSNYSKYISKLNGKTPAFIYTCNVTSKKIRTVMKSVHALISKVANGTNMQYKEAIYVDPSVGPKNFSLTFISRKNHTYKKEVSIGSLQNIILSLGNNTKNLKAFNQTTKLVKGLAKFFNSGVEESVQSQKEAPQAKKTTEIVQKAAPKTVQKQLIKPKRPIIKEKAAKVHASKGT